MKTILDEFLTYHLLELKFNSQNSGALDYLLSNNSDIADNITKNVCAKLSIPLSDKIDETSEMLGVSKRRFIEVALIEAINRANELFSEIGPYDHYADDQEASS